MHRVVSLYMHVEFCVQVCLLVLAHYIVATDCRFVYMP